MRFPSLRNRGLAKVEQNWHKCPIACMLQPLTFKKRVSSPFFIRFSMSCRACFRFCPSRASWIWLLRRRNTASLTGAMEKGYPLAQWTLKEATEVFPSPAPSTAHANVWAIGVIRCGRFFWRGSNSNGRRWASWVLKVLRTKWRVVLQARGPITYQASPWRFDLPLAPSIPQSKSWPLKQVLILDDIMRNLSKNSKVDLETLEAYSLQPLGSDVNVGRYLCSQLHVEIWDNHPRALCWMSLTTQGLGGQWSSTIWNKRHLR